MAHAPTRLPVHKVIIASLGALTLMLFVLSLFLPAATVTGNAQQQSTPSSPMSITVTATLTPSPTITLTPADGQERQLQEVPVLSRPRARVREIFAAGQKSGETNANVITKIGGSNSTSTAFLWPLDSDYYNLGPYQYLQETIDFFKGSFSQPSVAAQVGFNALTVLDTTWADPQLCKANETPLSCEYRRKQPAVAFIMFSANDLIHLTPERYEFALQQIIEQSIEANVIPVLTTFAQRPDSQWEKMIEFHLIMAAVAEEYEVPLINLWLAAQHLPEMGVGDDNIHYTRSGILDFNGEQNLRGHTLWSLLSLLTLHELREFIPMETDSSTSATPTPVQPT